VKESSRSCKTKTMNVINEVLPMQGQWTSEAAGNTAEGRPSGGLATQLDKGKRKDPSMILML
jgi:hypothetical protein